MSHSGDEQVSQNDKGASPMAEDRSKLIITKHRALNSKSGDLRQIKTFKFNQKVGKSLSSA
jgi:hypothetical protein